MTPHPQLRTIVIERLSEGAALFSYNQPKISNAFTVQQYLDLRDALIWAREEAAIRVVVLAGKGKHYCAGKAMVPQGDTIEQEVEAGGKLAEILLEFPKVIIAAVHGASIGWGCTQLYNFDLVYAHPAAFFQTPFMPLGFVPEGGSSYTFPKLMGKQRANALLLAGDRLSAQEMYNAGLVTAVVPSETPDEFLEKVCEKAKRIAEFNGESLRMAKALMKAVAGVEEQKEASKREGKDLLVRLNSEEGQASMKAFAEKSEGSKL